MLIDDEIGFYDMIGLDDGGGVEPLEFQVGIVGGSAVAYCPQTGHIATEPLRDQALQLARRGHLDEVSGDFLDALESLHLGDDLILEGSPYIGDDEWEVGAGKLRKKIKKVAKKAVKKVVKAGKAVAKSKLGKAIKASISIVNPAAGLAMSAVSKGAAIAKKAKKGQPKAKTTMQTAEALHKKKTTPKKAAKVAKANKIPRSDIKKTKKALDVAEAAKRGDPTARQVMDTHEAVETARVVPLQAAPEPSYDGGGGGAYEPVYDDSAALSPDYATDTDEPEAIEDTPQPLDDYEPEEVPDEAQEIEEDEEPMEEDWAAE